METISLIIMVLGLIALAAIYFISRVSGKNHPDKKKKLPPISTLKDQDGVEATSILDDQPAQDGKGPSENAQDLRDVMDESPENKPVNPDLPPQLIMFIAAETEEGFHGPRILEALENSGLTFGEMDVYHRMVLTENGETSLFNVANGIKPWTLVPEALAGGESTPGLSMVLNLPSPIEDSEAIHDFVRTAERLTSHLGGVLKNQHQETITAEQRRAYFAMV